MAKAREALPVESRPQDNANPCHSLENQVAVDPEDISLRERTISCYFDAQVKLGFSTKGAEEIEKSRSEHLLWLVQHAPDREPLIRQPPSSMLSSENYARMRQAWMSQVQTHPGDANVLINAARFFDSTEDAKAEELASRARAIDPKNVRAARELAQLYERKMTWGKPELKIQMAQQALQLREQIWIAMDPARQSSLTELASLALDAFEAGDNIKAQKWAQELARHDDPHAIHHGNVILGRLALKNGNLEEAKERLLAAGKNPGSPALGSFGPNMMLARELLMKGEKEVVLQYFDECGKFWDSGAKELDEWRRVVGQGRIPNFGANLFY